MAWEVLRYPVTVESLMRNKYHYDVVTSRSPTKAAVTASLHHIRRFPEGDDEAEIHDVLVGDGVLVDFETSANGRPMPVILMSDITDVSEW